MIRMRKVVVYARVSTEHEAQISALDNQIEFYDKLVSDHNDWELFEGGIEGGKYIDEGITGTSIKKREMFKKMLNDSEGGNFDLIVTREVSRFARNTLDAIDTARKLKLKGIEIYFVNENLWTIQDPDADFKLTMLAAFAQNESAHISQRVKAGQEVTFRKGKFYGSGNILGYDYNKFSKEVTINEEQARTVRFIYDMCLKGTGTRMIQYELERRGYLTSTGTTKWTPSTITRILRNPFYCGTIVYRKSYIPDFLEQKPKKNKGEVKQIIVDSKYPTIVTKEEFNKVQEILDSHRTYNNDKETKVGKPPVTVYGKKLVCECGASMQKKTYHKYKDGHTSWCYQCYSQLNTGSYTSRIKNGISTEGICKTKMIPEWKLKIVSLIAFEKVWVEKEQILSIIDNMLDSGLLESDTKQEIERLERKIVSLKAKKLKLLDTYLSEVFDKDTLDDKKVELDDDINKFQNQLDELNVRLANSNSIEDRLKECKKKIRNNFNYHRGELSDKLVDAFVDKIVVGNDHIEWYMKLCGSNNGIHLGRIKITKDDAISYSKYYSDLSKVYLKEPLYVDIYI